MSGLANQIGYFIFGLTNNFSYGIMLSAAEDLLEAADKTHANSTIHNASSILQPTSNSTSQNFCHGLSTSTILLADIVPSLVIELLYPFLLVGVPFLAKTVSIVGIAIAALILLASTSRLYFVFTGVALASLSSGLGESTYLASTSVYGFKALAGYTSGTGAAGLISALVYALMTIFMSTRAIMLSLMVAPIAMLCSHLFVIDDESSIQQEIPSSSTHLNQPAKQSNNESTQTITTSSNTMSLGEKLRYLPSLYVYMVPMFLVYVAEYFINQGITQLIYYPEITYLDRAAQYRWFQVSYQLGVFISRSSIMCFTVSNIWLMSILQGGNAILFTAHAAKLVHLPNFYLVMALILFEGLLGGSTYANCFVKIRNEVEPSKRQFATSAVVTCGVMGITAAGFLAIPAHDALCKLYL